MNCDSIGIPRSGPAGAHYMVFNSASKAWRFELADYNIASVQARLLNLGWAEDVVSKLSQPNRKQCSS